MAAIESELAKQCDALPRNETARKALAHSYVVHVSGRSEAAAFSNAYAPEHLIVNVADAEEWLPLLDNAGGCGGQIFIRDVGSNLQLAWSCGCFGSSTVV